MTPRRSVLNKFTRAQFIGLVLATFAVGFGVASAFLGLFSRLTTGQGYLGSYIGLPIVFLFFFGALAWFGSRKEGRHKEPLSNLSRGEYIYAVVSSSAIVFLVVLLVLNEIVI